MAPSLSDPVTLAEYSPLSIRGVNFGSTLAGGAATITTVSEVGVLLHNIQERKCVNQWAIPPSVSFSCDAVQHVAQPGLFAVATSDDRITCWSFGNAEFEKAPSVQMPEPIEKLVSWAGSDFLFAIGKSGALYVMHMEYDATDPATSTPTAIRLASTHTSLAPAGADVAVCQLIPGTNFSTILIWSRQGHLFGYTVPAGRKIAGRVVALAPFTLESVAPATLTAASYDSGSFAAAWSDGTIQLWEMSLVEKVRELAPTKVSNAILDSATHNYTPAASRKNKSFHLGLCKMDRLLFIVIQSSPTALMLCVFDTAHWILVQHAILPTPTDEVASAAGSARTVAPGQMPHICLQQRHGALAAVGSLSGVVSSIHLQLSGAPTLLDTLGLQDLSRKHISVLDADHLPGMNSVPLDKLNNRRSLSRSTLEQREKTLLKGLSAADLSADAFSAILLEYFTVNQTASPQYVRQYDPDEYSRSVQPSSLQTPAMSHRTLHEITLLATTRFATFPSAVADVLFSTGIFSTALAPFLVERLLTTHQAPLLHLLVLKVTEIAEEHLVSMLRYSLTPRGAQIINSFFTRAFGKAISRSARSFPIDQAAPSILFQAMIFSAAFSDVALEQHVKTLALDQVEELLRRLLILLQNTLRVHPSKMRKIFTQYIRMPTVNQLLDWISILLDCHYSQIMLNPQKNVAFIQDLHELVSSQIHLLDAYTSIRGYLTGFEEAAIERTLDVMTGRAASTSEAAAARNRLHRPASYEVFSETF
ncbi:hypothetical protein H696_01559 [Fonticula alba]|uniref:Nucleolar protein 11 C-terminal domain-containing protein n=1 Tax=Fonticula alba TaxID=691883 RepID=A0A058ZF99_FONAL|nr:hypothetical protein H696_01559 [Fonticula alba]KCV72157.1 hypothetical protein H696_01559 [Fonticula alba]|eukprot:XP_009493735.1 hypothetical protein H696_01559 [Fonticula alba]